MRRSIIALLAVLATLAATSAIARDPKQVRAYRSAHPCPVTQQTTGPCPGWVVDHIIPLCAGGADHPSNLRWLERETARIKDPRDASTCAALRRYGWRPSAGG
jgi:hypothetical protein